MNTQLLIDARERMKHLELTLSGLFKQLNAMKEGVTLEQTEVEQMELHRHIRRIENYIVFLELQKSRTFIVIETSLAESPS